MTQFSVFSFAETINVVGSHSFTTGFVPCKKRERFVTEEDALSRALWLERRGRKDEADTFLERFCARKR